jgi:hypothetical protein
MSRRLAKPCLLAVSLFALIAHGCTKRPEGYQPKLSDLRVDYSSWNCRDLADEADEVNTALAVATEQRSVEHVSHLNAQKIAVQKARVSKKCLA